jgi:hypothetical protein
METQEYVGEKMAVPVYLLSGKVQNQYKLVVLPKPP